MTLPLSIATACCLRRGDETLFIDYTKYPHPLHAGKFSIPGGHVEPGESFEEATIREATEETGIIINNLNLRGKVLFLNERRIFNGKSAKSNFEVHFYDSYYFDDRLARATEGKLVWVPNERVSSLEMHEGDKVIWGWLQEHPYFEGEIEHVGEKLARATLVSS